MTLPSDKNYFQISDILLENIRYKFFEYTAAFVGNQNYNKHIHLKKFHTEKVCKEIAYIGSHLGMNKEEVNYAEALAWFHDIGRFEQFDKYGTFSDADSENHSEIALRVLKEQGLTDGLTEKQKSIISASILNHNIPQVPDDIPEDIDFYSRLLRDADKLDIWRVNLEINIFHKIKVGKQADHYSIPKKLIDYVINHQIIPITDVNKFYDSFIFRISWLYDINFPITIKLIKERKIIQKLFDRVPYSDDLELLQNIVLQHLEELLLYPIDNSFN